MPSYSNLRYIIFCCVVVLSSGCFRGTVYEMGGKTYAIRTEAEYEQSKILEERLDNCKAASRSFNGMCLLILPDSDWILNNIVAKKRAKSDLIDYRLTIIQKEIENYFQLIKKSGIFSQSELVRAAVGNGQNEPRDNRNFLEVSIGKVDKKIYCIFTNPISNQAIQVALGDILYSSIYGWGWLFDQVKVLQ